ncbi:hypothetical protein TrVFT333_010250 [Trichoderma virens FT-333]|nr:hypothetical protein TrVFT333_010250 [Trichoderma virens FT-333]
MSSVQPDISKIFVNYLRNSRQLSCPICQVDVKPPTFDGFKQHVQNSAEKHPTGEKAILEAFQKMKLSSSKPQPQPASAIDNDPQNRRSRKRSGGAAALDRPDDQQTPDHSHLNVNENSDNEGPNKKVCSPRNSPPPTTSTPNRRGRGRQQADNKEFDRGTKGSSTRQLWNPSSAGLPRPSQLKAQPLGHRSRPLPRAKITQHEAEEPDPEPGPAAETEADNSYTEDPSVSQLIRQPETRPISQEQLVAEVKGIYAGLVMVESKCIEVDNAQSANKDSPQQLNNEQWQALIALHRTLLHEHHDFFLASQHPSASPALRRLASNPAMKFVEHKYPWKLMATMLNYLKQSCKFQPRIDSAVFPGAENQDHYRPLPEDYAMRGLIYTEEYFPLKWFSGETVEEDEKYFEQASMVDARKERILWIGRQIASVGKWLLWDEKSAKFTVADEYDIEFTARTPEMGAKEIVDLGASTQDIIAPHQTN